MTLPTTTYNGTVTSITASGSVSPSTITSFVASNVGVEFRLGFNDTYTVHGSAAGVFPITTTFGVTGTASTFPSGANQVLLVGNANVFIGNYFVDTTSFPSGPYPSVSPFDPSSEAHTGGITLVNQPPVNINISASYTKMVSVGNIFDIGYLLTSAFARGTIDLSHTATISFDLPDGVYLTSELGGVFGDAPTAPGDTPIPAALPLFAGGLCVIGLLARRKKRSAAALAA